MAKVNYNYIPIRCVHTYDRSVLIWVMILEIIMLLLDAGSAFS